MSTPEPDSSTASNNQLLCELSAFIVVFQVPFLGRNPSRFEALKTSPKKVKKTLA
jgi:hypothetical protein